MLANFVLIQVVYSNVYMLDDGLKWKELPPMPKPDSHIEFAWVNVNNSLIIAGGTTEKHPVTKKMVLVGEIFRFNLDTLVLLKTPQPFYRTKREETFSYLFIFLQSVVDFTETRNLHFFRILLICEQLLGSIKSTNYQLNEISNFRVYKIKEKKI